MRDRNILGLERENIYFSFFSRFEMREILVENYTQYPQVLTTNEVCNVLCIAYCVLRTVYCVLYIAYCVLRIVYCVLCIAYYVLRIGYCVLCIAYYVLRIGYCVLCIAYCV